MCSARIGVPVLRIDEAMALVADDIVWGLFSEQVGASFAAAGLPLERVGFERVTGPYYHFAPRSVTYVLTPAAVEARDRALVTAGRRPPRYGLLGPGDYVLEAGYVGGRRRLYELLAAAHHRYGGIRPS